MSTKPGWALLGNSAPALHNVLCCGIYEVEHACYLHSGCPCRPVRQVEAHLPLGTFKMPSACFLA